MNLETKKGKFVSDSRYDNLREYKREMGITAKLRKRPKMVLSQDQRKPCGKPGCKFNRFEHERQGVLVPDHNFVEVEP